MGVEHGKHVHMGDLVTWWYDDGIKIAPLLPEVSDVGNLSRFCVHGSAGLFLGSLNIYCRYREGTMMMVMMN